MLTIILVAFSLGADNFAGSVAIGIAGADARTRLRVAIAFGLFEGGMPLLGLLLGRTAAGALGSQAAWAGGGLLIVAGLHELWAARSEADEEDELRALRSRNWLALLITAAALSIDNLIVGFALGAHRVSLLLAAVTIALVSVLMSLAGMEVGERLGRRLARQSELLGGLALIAVGAAIASGLL